jgi:hypothetical protein
MRMTKVDASSAFRGILICCFFSVFGAVVGTLCSGLVTENGFAFILQHFYTGLQGGFFHRFFSQLLFPAAIFLSGFFLLGFVTVPCILFIKGLSFSLLFYGIIAAGAGTSPGRLAVFFLPDAVLVFPLLIVLGAVSLRSSLGLLREHSKSGVRPGFRLNYFLLAAVVAAMLLRCFLAAAFSHFII